MSIDKVDIALHIGVGAAAILVIGTGVWWFTESPLGFFGAALVNSFAWPIREMSQRKGHDPWPLQKHLEAWPSPVIGWLVAFGAEALIAFGGSLIT